MKRPRTRSPPPHTHTQGPLATWPAFAAALVFLPDFPAVRGNLTRQSPWPVDGCDLVTAVVTHDSRVATDGHGAM